MALALNNPRRLTCHLTKKLKLNLLFILHKNTENNQEPISMFKRKKKNEKKTRPTGISVSIYCYFSDWVLSIRHH